MMYAIAESWEAAFSQWRRGLLTDRDWEKWIAIIGVYKAAPGIDGWWPQQERMFSAEFREYWQTILPQREIHQEYWDSVQSKLPGEDR